MFGCLAGAFPNIVVTDLNGQRIEIRSIGSVEQHITLLTS
jgi:hypothetical protein